MYSSLSARTSYGWMCRIVLAYCCPLPFLPPYCTCSTSAHVESLDLDMKNSSALNCKYAQFYTCMSSYRMRDEFTQNAPLKRTPYLLLRLLGLQQGMPVSNGLAWISQHLVPVVSAKSLSVASHPHHTNDLIMTYPVATHTDCVNTPHLSRHDSSHVKLLLLTARRAFCNGRRHKSEPGRHAA